MFQTGHQVLIISNDKSVRHDKVELNTLIPLNRHVSLLPGLKQAKVGIRPLSTERTVQCWLEAMDLLLLVVAAASRRPRFLECGHR